MIVLSQLYPEGLDFRQQVRDLTEKFKKILMDNECLTVDVSGACLSRAAMDEFYKSFIDPKAELTGRITIVNTDEDFDLKLSAVQRSQYVKKPLRRFKKEQIITILSAKEMKDFVGNLQSLSGDYQ